jgi:hypothetical protein
MDAKQIHHHRFPITICYDYDKGGASRQKMRRNALAMITSGHSRLKLATLLRQR